MALSLPRFFQLRQRYLARGVLVSLATAALSLRLEGFPDDANLHGSNWQPLLAAVVFAAMFDTARCLGRKLNFYYAGVLVLLYAELMILALVVFLWLFL